MRIGIRSLSVSHEVVAMSEPAAPESHEMTPELAILEVLEYASDG
jgi:hypothetical protein